MAEIEVISFDMEGTLVPLDFSKIIWETDIPRIYSEKNSLAFNEAKKDVIAEYDSIGPSAPEWYDIDYWFKRLGLDNDWHQLLKERKSICIPFPDVVGVLTRLQHRYRLIVSSNTIRDFLDILIQCLPRVFESVFSAPSDFGGVKDATFYFNVSKNLGVKFENIIHVGDSIKYDYSIPNQLGLKAYLLDRTGKSTGPHVIRDLEDFEFLLNSN